MEKTFLHGRSVPLLERRSCRNPSFNGKDISTFPLTIDLPMNNSRNPSFNGKDISTKNVISF